MISAVESDLLNSYQFPTLAETIMDVRSPVYLMLNSKYSNIKLQDGEHIKLYELKIRMSTLLL